MKKMKQQLAFLAAVVLLLPTLLTGCMSADKLAERRAKTDEVSKKAEEYMKEKYRRGFQAKHCEFAEGDEYEGGFLITFNNDIHAYYDSNADMFYDDRQSAVINEDIFSKIWIPMMEDIGLPYDNVGLWSLDFNLVYEYVKGGELKKYSMYNEYYSGDALTYARLKEVSVRTGNLVLVGDDVKAGKVYEALKEYLDTYFKGKKNDAKFFIISSLYHSSMSFDADSLDETVDGVLYRLHYTANEHSIVRHQFLPVDGVEGLYAMVYSQYGETFQPEDIALVPVSNSDATQKSIKENMDSREMGLVDKYVTKKRSVEMETPLYKVEFSGNVKESAVGTYTVAFVMKDSDEEITEYAAVKERERSFFAYNLNGDEFNATCLCSKNSRSTPFTFGKKDEVYFWFGTQF